jgi:diguanylate cyclase (GGDEF)-like protein
MHSPTLITFGAMLIALVSCVLFAVWRFNKHIPGLQMWALSYGVGLVPILGLLWREHLPEVLGVLMVQAGMSLGAFLYFWGCSVYTGRRLLSLPRAIIFMGALLLLNLYFTVVQPHLQMRFALGGVGNGIFFLLTARTLAQGGYQRVPMRYLVAAVAGAHGVFLLLRPLLFGIGAVQANASLAAQIPHLIMLEFLIALLFMAFGTLMLANEFTTNELRQLAEIDSLTSIFNRRAFFTLLNKALHQSQRTGMGLAVLVVDLDHFKSINDTYGHQGGDEVLRHFVQTATQCLRQQDVMGRLGGEEFAIFLPGVDAKGAQVVAERLRAAVASRPAALQQGSHALTISLGLTLCVPGDTPDTALHRADQAMYQAKERGRNRVELQLFAWA